MTCDSCRKYLFSSNQKTCQVVDAIYNFFIIITVLFIFALWRGQLQWIFFIWWSIFFISCSTIQCHNYEWNNKRTTQNGPLAHRDDHLRFNFPSIHILYFYFYLMCSVWYMHVIKPEESNISISTCLTDEIKIIKIIF